MPKNTLPPYERIKSHEKLTQLFKKSESLFEYPFKLVYLLDDVKNPKDALAQFGISVSKKKMARANQRNLIKRYTREGYRKNKHALNAVLKTNKQQMALFFIYVGTTDVKAAWVEQKIILILNRLVRKLASNTTES